MLKVLVVHNKYQQSGGESEAVEAQINLLRHCGHEVVLYQRDNAEIQEYNLVQKIGFFPETVFSKRTFHEISELIVEERPDVAHIHNVFPLISPSVYEAIASSCVPIIQTVHNFRFMCPNGLFYTHGTTCERCKYGNTLHAVRLKCYRQSYPLSALYALSIGWSRYKEYFEYIDRFITLTDFAAQKLSESGIAPPQRIVTLGHFLPGPLPVYDASQDKSSYLLYMGRLSSEKGIEVLLRAISQLPFLNLKIAGSGPLAGTLEAYCSMRGMNQVEFLGHVSGEQKWDLLRHAFAVVLPSVCYETFGLAAIESMAVGTPVIASNLGSLPYVVEDNRAGLLFSAGNSDSLKEKLVWALEHSETMASYGRNARQVVEQRFSAANHYQQLMEIYTSVI